MTLVRTNFQLELWNNRLDRDGTHHICGRHELEQFCYKLDEVMQIVFNNLETDIGSELDPMKSQLVDDAASLSRLHDCIIPEDKIRTIVKAEVIKCFSRMVAKRPDFIRDLREAIDGPQEMDT